MSFNEISNSACKIHCREHVQHAKYTVGTMNDDELILDFS